MRVTGFEKIDHCDNKLKLRNHTVNQFTLFFKNKFFCRRLIFRHIWVKAIKRKSFNYGGQLF